MENLCVIYSDFQEEGIFFVVSFETMQKKTTNNPELGEEHPEFKRLDKVQEAKALIVYEQKGDEQWKVMQGGDGDFFIARIMEI